MFIRPILTTALALISLSHICWAKDIKVSLIKVNPMGTFKDSETNPGIHKEYLQELFKRANLKAEFSVDPYARVLSNVQTGLADLILVFERNDLKNTITIGKSIGFNIFIVSRKEAPLNANHLRGKRVGVILPGKYEDKFDKDKSIQHYPLKNYSQGFLLLAKKRLDAVVLPEPWYYYNLNRLKGLKNSFAAPSVLNKKYNFLYANQNLDQSIVEKIRNANNELMKENYIKKLISKYKSL